jgi:hypothetical protein
MKESLNLWTETVLIGDEAIYLYSKALTAYAKCEAMCNGMYEVLVPQPTTPEDLGLDPLEPY